MKTFQQYLVLRETHDVSAQLGQMIGKPVQMKPIGNGHMALTVPDEESLDAVMKLLPQVGLKQSGPADTSPEGFSVTVSRVGF